MMRKKAANDWRREWIINKVKAMGVDYESIFGIGYEIDIPIEEDESTYRLTPDGRLIEDMYDFSQYVRESSRYWLAETGNIYECEPEMKWYIFIKESNFSPDLTEEKEKLDKYCQEMHIRTRGEFGLYGGMLID